MPLRTPSLIVVMFAATAIAQAEPATLPEPDLTALPQEEAALRDLNVRQLQIVRRALRGCGASYSSGASVSGFRDPCVTRWSDQTIDAADDPALHAFHWSLPARERYDEYRSSSVWRRWAADLR